MAKTVKPEDSTDQKVVKVDDKMTIEYTAKAEFGKPGEKVTVHRLVAEKLIAKEFAKEVK